MAIKVNYISHIGINVRDMQASFDFYCGILGFKHVWGFQRDGKPWIEYVKVSKDRFLEFFHPAEGLDYYSDLTAFHHICLSVDDIHAAEKTLDDANWPVDQRPKQGSDLNWQLWTHDPDGNKLEIMQISADSPQAKS